MALSVHRHTHTLEERYEFLSSNLRLKLHLRLKHGASPYLVNSRTPLHPDSLDWHARDHIAWEDDAVRFDAEGLVKEGSL